MKAYFIKKEVMNIKAVFDNYFLNLKHGNKKECFNTIEKAVDAGLDIKDIYLNVFYPAMIKVGELWEANKFTVAQEHLATAITQRIMSYLYSNYFDFSIENYKAKIIMTCAGSELHELGARMTADLLELQGYDVIYLGANTPVFTILNTISSEKPDFIGISCTMSFNIKYTKELIGKIQETDEDIKIIVGGRAYTTDSSLIDYVQADFYGNSLDSTLEFLEENKRIMVSNG